MPIFQLVKVKKITYLNHSNQKKNLHLRCGSIEKNHASDKLKNATILESTTTFRLLKKISTGKRINFISRLTQQLHFLIDSGLVISDALIFIMHHEKKHQSLLHQLSKKIDNGFFFHDALQQHSEFFSPIFIAIIRSSEQSGTMASGLKHLSHHLSFQQSTLTSIKKSLTYPCCLLISTLLACYAISTFILPKFSELFSGFNQSLPYLTQLVIEISHSIKNIFPLIGIVIVFFTATGMITKKSKTFRGFSLLAKLPFISSLLTFYHRMIFCQISHIALSENIPLLDTLDLCKQAIACRSFQTHITSCAEYILQGYSITDSFNHTQLFTQRDLVLIASAEKSHRLSSVFQSLTKQYHAQLNDRIHAMKRLIEPLILIILSLIIGTVILAIYLPIFNMGNAF